MGYYRDYSLKVELPPIADIIDSLRKQSEEASYCLEPDGSSSESGKWYDHEEDLLEFSRQNPGILFTLEGKGQEQGDHWKKYFMNGMIQIEEAQVTIGDFDLKKLT